MASRILKFMCSLVPLGFRVQCLTAERNNHNGDHHKCIMYNMMCIYLTYVDVQMFFGSTTYNVQTAQPGPEHHGNLR